LFIAVVSTKLIVKGNSKNHKNLFLGETLQNLFLGETLPAPDSNIGAFFVKKHCRRIADMRSAVLL
jgi:hypothetical protein